MVWVLLSLTLLILRCFSTSLWKAPTKMVDAWHCWHSFGVVAAPQSPPICKGPPIDDVPTQVSNIQWTQWLRMGASLGLGWRPIQTPKGSQNDMNRGLAFQTQTALGGLDELGSANVHLLPIRILLSKIGKQPTRTCL
jgi:hypothetical protein